MSQYSVYFLDDGGRVTSVSAAVFENDEAAGRWANTISGGRPIELWSPDRQVEVHAAAARARSNASDGGAE